MAVHSIVGDFPELRITLPDDLRCRINVAERDGGLVLEVDVRQLGTERGVHAAIVQREQFLNGLVVERRALHRSSR